MIDSPLVSHVFLTLEHLPVYRASIDRLATLLTLPERRVCPYVFRRYCGTFPALLDGRGDGLVTAIATAPPIEGTFFLAAGTSKVHTTHLHLIFFARLTADLSYFCASRRLCFCIFLTLNSTTSRYFHVRWQLPLSEFNLPSTHNHKVEYGIATIC